MPYKIDKRTGSIGYANASTGATLTPAPKQNFLGKVADVFVPRTAQLFKKAKAGLALSALTDEAENDREERQKRIEQMIARAKQEADPVRRSQMLGQARDLAKQGSDQIKSAVQQFEGESGTKINDKERIFAEALGVAGELGTFMLPAGKLAAIGKTGKVVSRAGQATEAVTSAQRILKGAKLGATVGAIHATTDPERETLEEKFKGALVEGGIGFLAGGATSAVLEGTLKAAKGFLGTTKSRTDKVARLFRITPSKRRELRAATDGMDFESEILARDAQEIAGMDYDQMAVHFGNRLTEAERGLDDVLVRAKGAVKKQDLITAIQKKVSGLQPRKGNVGTSSAISQLEGIAEDLSQFPGEELELVTANNVKRQLQSLGQAAFSPNGKATPISQAFADVSTVVKNSIEKAAQTAKGKNPVKDANRNIQLYHAAKEAIETTGDREAVKVTNDLVSKFLQVLPVTAGVAGATGGFLAGGPAGGLGGAALATILVGGGAGAARVKYLSPQVQTKMIARFQGLLSSNGVKNAAQMATDITQSISKHVARLATLPGTEDTPKGGQGFAVVGLPELTSMSGDITQVGEPDQKQVNQQLQRESDQNSTYSPEQNGIDHVESISHMVKIRNKKTGEMLEVPQSSLGKYGLSADAADAVPGLPTKGEILAAMVLDAQKGGKNIAKLKTILDAYDQVGEGAGKTVPATQAGALADYDSAISLMDEVETTLSKSRGKFGPVKGGVGSANPYDREAQMIDADLRRATQIVGKAMEGGVLRKEDEIKYRRMLPKLTDTPEVADYKMNQVRSMLQRNREQRIRALISAGYDPETDRITGGGTESENPLEY